MSTRSPFQLATTYSIEYALPDGRKFLIEERVAPSGEQFATYSIDGKPVTAEEARTMVPEAVTSIGLYTETWEV